MITDAQQNEIAKYHAVYKFDDYGMGPGRKNNTIEAIMARPDLKGSLLDVGCGRGELLDWCEEKNIFNKLQGVEVVPELIDECRVVYGVAWALPFEYKSFETVTCLDVLEHLLPGDECLALRELRRVAQRRVILTASNVDSDYGDKIGQLHVNKRPYYEWDGIIRSWFTGWTVTKIENVWRAPCEMWEATR